VAFCWRRGFTDLAVTPLVTERRPLEPHPPSILFPDITPSPTAAQHGEQEQEDSADRRSNSDEDCLVPTEPSGDTATVVALPDVWWAGGSEVIQEGLTASRVDTIQSDLDKVLMSLSDFCGREELDVWVGDFVLLSVDEVTEIDEHIGVSEESHSQNQVIILVGGNPRLERTNAELGSIILAPGQGSVQGMNWVLHTADQEGEVDLNVTGEHPSSTSAAPNITKVAPGILPYMASETCLGTWGKVKPVSKTAFRRGPPSTIEVMLITLPSGPMIPSLSRRICQC